MPLPATRLVGGAPVPEDRSHEQIDPSTGLQKDYVVLSDEERAKGFVRPMRREYTHVGRPGPKYPLRDLTDEERERYAGAGYVKFEVYPESESPRTGRFWTQEDFDRIDAGCKTVTSMVAQIAETYARQPGFYGGTYCVACKKHFPVGADGEFVWRGTDERVGT